MNFLYAVTPHAVTTHPITTPAVATNGRGSTQPIVEIIIAQGNDAMHMVGYD